MRTRCAHRRGRVWSPPGSQLPRSSQMALESNSTVVDLPAGAVLCAEGTPSREVFVLLEGCVEVRCGVQTLAHLGAVSLIGEMGLHDDAPRSASVVASTPVTVAALSIPEFRHLCRTVPEFDHWVATTVASRARSTGEPD